MSWTDAAKPFDAQAISISEVGEIDGGIVDFERVMGSFAVHWVVDNPDQFALTVRLYGSLDSVNYYDLGVDVPLAAAGTNPPPAGLNTLVATTGKPARWIRPNVYLYGGNPFGGSTSDGATVTAILVADE